MFRTRVLARALLLEREGPSLGRPHAGTLTGSKHANMKELRCSAADGVWRIALAFDPRRQAILLAAGDKSGGSGKRFYRQLIARADERFDSHLKRRQRMTTMARTLKDKLAALDPARRTGIQAEADRLHTEYLTLQELRKAREMTQVQLAETLGIRQATVAKYERQSDLLLSTLTSYVRAIGGDLRLMVEFPGKAPVSLEGLGDTEGPRPRGRAAREKRQAGERA